MPRFEVAHMHTQGQDMIVIPLDNSFGCKSQADQDAITDELQMRAASAGLRGTVVPVWDAGGGRMSFIAPRPWHPYFRSIGLAHIALRLNRALYW
jgi:hypothetical protein